MKNYLYLHINPKPSFSPWLSVDFYGNIIGSPDDEINMSFDSFFTHSFYIFNSFSFAAITLFLLKLHWFIRHCRAKAAKWCFMQILMYSFCCCFSFQDNCRNRPHRPPRKPLRPSKASKQLPPEPTHVESDDVKKLWFSPSSSHKYCTAGWHSHIFTTNMLSLLFCRKTTSIQTAATMTTTT